MKTSAVVLCLMLCSLAAQAQVALQSEGSGFVVFYNTGNNCNHFGLTDGTKWATDHSVLGEAVYATIRQKFLEHAINPALGNVTVYTSQGDPYVQFPAFTNPTVLCGASSGIIPFSNAISVYTN